MSVKNNIFLLINEIVNQDKILDIIKKGLKEKIT